MLTKLSKDELSAVYGGADLFVLGTVFTGAGAIFSALGALFHAAGDPEDPKGMHTIFTEHTANVITFVCSSLSTVSTGVGTILITIANGRHLANVKEE